MLYVPGIIHAIGARLRLAAAAAAAAVVGSLLSLAYHQLPVVRCLGIAMSVFVCVCVRAECAMLAQHQQMSEQSGPRRTTRTR